MTTYAENIGVMAATKVYSTLLFAVAAIVSILLGFSPKFGALVLSIPGPVIGGLSIVLFGLIAAMAGRIWVENKVDFSNPRNLITVAAALTAGAGSHSNSAPSRWEGSGPQPSAPSSSIKFSRGTAPNNNVLGGLAHNVPKQPQPPRSSGRSQTSGRTRHR